MVSFIMSPASCSPTRTQLCPQQSERRSIPQDGCWQQKLGDVIKAGFEQLIFFTLVLATAITRGIKGSFRGQRLLWSIIHVNVWQSVDIVYKSAHCTVTSEGCSLGTDGDSDLWLLFVFFHHQSLIESSFSDPESWKNIFYGDFSARSRAGQLINLTN